MLSLRTYHLVSVSNIEQMGSEVQKKLVDLLKWTTLRRDWTFFSGSISWRQRVSILSARITVMYQRCARELSWMKNQDDEWETDGFEDEDLDLAADPIYRDQEVDGSSVKFYLNRWTDDADDSTNGHEDDDTIKAESSFGEGDTMQKAQYLSSSTSDNLDRFASSNSLSSSSRHLPRRSSGGSSNFLLTSLLRWKIFMLPKNVTIAEVTEIGSENFGMTVDTRLRIRRRKGGVELGSGTVWRPALRESVNSF